MMKNRLVQSGLWSLALCSIALCANAQAIYRIVDANGKVSFSDKPPSERAAIAGAATTGSGNAAIGDASASDSGALPYVLRQTMVKNPVILYTAKDCTPCNSGRALLQQRGVPFSEKLVASAEDMNALQQLTGDTSIPVLRVGTLNLKGFLDSEWSQTLDMAGYPKTSVLPRTYHNPAATALVAATPKTPPPASPASATQQPLSSTPAYTTNKPSTSNPAGIQF
jgi:glutaredoxin